MIQTTEQDTNLLKSVDVSIISKVESDSIKYNYIYNNYNIYSIT